MYVPNRLRRLGMRAHLCSGGKFKQAARSSQFAATVFQTRSICCRDSRLTPGLMSGRAALDMMTARPDPTHLAIRIPTTVTLSAFFLL